MSEQARVVVIVVPRSGTDILTGRPSAVRWTRLASWGAKLAVCRKRRVRKVRPTASIERRVARLRETVLAGAAAWGVGSIFGFLEGFVSLAVVRRAINDKIRRARLADVDDGVVGVERRDAPPREPRDRGPSGGPFRVREQGSDPHRSCSAARRSG